MKKSLKADTNLSVDQLLQKTYSIYFEYVVYATDKIKAHQLAKKCYDNLTDYFKNLKKFEIQNNGGITTLQNLSENDILAFSVWMQQFLEELRGFVIGLGKVDPEEITVEIREQLKEINFYEYFEQAKALNY